MAKIPEQFIQQVLQATDIVEFIGQYLTLTKRGKEYLGLCPFHDDRRPSLNVSPVKQIYKCFACQAGGNAIRFLMDFEKITFPEAVRSLAQRANMNMPVEVDTTPASPGMKKNDLLEIVALAQEYFKAQLRSPTGKAALDYARSRGLSDDTIQRFHLGYAPDSWDALASAARRKGYRDSQLIAAGLAAPREDGGCYDRFRNRLMFPIYDLSGRTIAFGGRALSSEERAKYINSPETPLFDKSSQMYAINWSRDAIRQTRQAIVVEGYLDALIPIQCGVHNVVATLGTALTGRHVRQLAHFAGEVVLVFDADQAGAAAAQRALEEFIAQQVSVRVATIPAGKDPADFCLSHGGEAFKTLIADAPDAMQYVLDRHMAAYRDAGSNLADRRRIIEDFLQLIVNSAAYGAIDQVRRGQLAQHVGHLLNVPAVDLQQQMQRLARRSTTRSQAPTPAAALSAGAPLAEREIIEVLLNAPQLFDHAAERMDPDDFTDPGLRAIALHIWQKGGQGRLHLDELLANEQMITLGPLITELVAAGERRANYQATLVGAVDEIVRRRSTREVDALKTADSDDALRKLAQHLRHDDMRRTPRIN